MSKTTPSYRETKYGILSITEIEGVIFDNLIQTKAYLLRNYETLEWTIETLCTIHSLLCSSHFDDWGKYRKHQVQLWSFIPIQYYSVPIEMKNLDDDIRIRSEHAKTIEEKQEFLAYVMWKILWIHPFFDYNGRTVRLFWELFLLKENMPLSTFAGASRNTFTEAMKRATNEGVFDDIIELL